MAIGLGDLAAKNKVATQKVGEVRKTSPINNDLLKNHNEATEKNNRQNQLRPWEAKSQAQKSTVASLAVKKASEVAMKNEAMARELRKSFTSAQKELELEMYIENREKEFLNMDNSRDLNKSRKRIHTHRSFLKRLRDSLFRS
ncbi:MULTISPECIES: hypothetical protein [Halobacteriovorax]|uniref:Uncharacterized protein n=1 Tax=Halobacteriovorax vibrionivorans TaxID=2152716 RepID=A0ABY0IM72_9BACT|nr:MULTISPECIES: hypothetical protein [Halobacteriovorax]AYF45255.1 hypothetical protein BALOs_2257 [Halobacteriovorax sp. BALOs_7]RZF22342.1 hypothetical protein DAY19_00820 [Halobacteriovorax vibrionivorans]TGD48594.1 hypothetical protein EP118_03735 [Halobacteriovorax sp. Y22]